MPGEVRLTAATAAEFKQRLQGHIDGITTVREEIVDAATAQFKALQETQATREMQLLEVLCDPEDGYYDPLEDMDNDDVISALDDIIQLPQTTPPAPVNYTQPGTRDPRYDRVIQ